jgi:hypothetical protein
MAQVANDRITRFNGKMWNDWIMYGVCRDKPLKPKNSDDINQIIWTKWTTLALKFMIDLIISSNGSLIKEIIIITEEVIIN